MRICPPLQWILFYKLHICIVANIGVWGCGLAKKVSDKTTGWKGNHWDSNVQTAGTISPHVTQTSKLLEIISSKKLWIHLDTETHSTFWLREQLLLAEHLCQSP